MSEVYNDKDTNYDYEEPFDDEMDNEELDDEYEESPENMTLKEKAEAEGMSVREYISEVSFRRGPVGVISGIGFGIIGVIGQAVHVLIKAIVFALKIPPVAASCITMIGTQCLIPNTLSMLSTVSLPSNGFPDKIFTIRADCNLLAANKIPRITANVNASAKNFFK